MSPIRRVSCAYIFVRCRGCTVVPLYLLRLALGQPQLATALPLFVWLGLGIPILSLDQRDFDNVGPNRVAPGQRILEIGPGPGRLLIPAAKRVEPGGEAVGIDIQPGMIDRLKKRVAEAGITNLNAILGDATQPHFDEPNFDLVFLVTTLGEIPDRAAALAESYKALKPGGVLSITEIFGIHTTSLVQRSSDWLKEPVFI